jgi:gliding motility-associated-like protein
VHRPVPLVGTPAGGNWTGPGVTGSQAAGYVFTPSAAVVGTQVLTYTLPGTGLCTTSDVRLVTVLPPASAGADTVLCPGSTQSFRLRGTPAGGVFSGVGVSGSLANGFTFTPPPGFSGSAVVTYTITSATLCSGNAQRRISVAAAPTIQPTWVTTNCPEYRLNPLTLRFSLNGTGLPAAPTVAWEFGDGSQSAELNPTHTYTTAGSFTPRVRLRYNSDRCDVQATLPVVEVKTQKVPNIITPNGDGQNQTFQLGPDCYPRLQIFSRWGRQVFESAAYHDDWAADGLPSGVYYYLAVYPDGHRLKGTVEVMR